MKNLLLIIFISFSVLIFSEDRNWKPMGKMTFNCVVKDQIILTIEDGESQRFLGYEGGLQTGDRHSFKIEWFDIRDGKYQYEKESEKKKVGVVISEDGETSSTLVFNRMVEFEERDFMGLTFARESETYADMRLYLYPYYGDELKVSASLIYEPNKNRSFKRYYKNDWDYVKTDEQHILVSNCMNAKGDISKFMKDSISLFKK